MNSKNPEYQKNSEWGLDSRMSKLKLVFYLFIPVVLLFYSLGSYRTLGSHEAFAVVPAQEMIEAGDWTVPRFGGIPRLRKPPLAYWVIAATGKIIGLGVNELTARIPAAISAILLAFVVGYWAKKWYGFRAGILAGFIQATSIYVVIYGRKAEIDMLLCLLTTSSLFLVANSDDSETRKQRWIRWTSLYVLLSISWLAKFHYGMAIIVGPSVIYLLVQKRFRSFLNLINPIGLILFAAAILIWPYLVLQQLPNASAVWMDETVGRAMGTKGTDPFWFYLPFLIWMPMPWTPLACWGGFQSFKQAWKQGDSRERFLWIWFLTVLMIVSVQPVKHSHYLLGCLPMFSLLAARPAVKLLELLNRSRPLLSRFWAISVFNTFTVFGICLAVAIPVKWPLLMEPALILGGIFVIGGIVIAFFLQTDRPIRAFHTLAVTMMAGFVLSYGWILPVRDHRAQSAQYAKTVRNYLQEGERLSSFQLGMDPIIYYLDSPVNRIETIGEIEKSLNENKRLTLIAHRSETAILRNFGELEFRHHFQVNRDFVMPKKADWVIVDLIKRESPVQVSQNECDQQR